MALECKLPFISMLADHRRENDQKSVFQLILLDPLVMFDDINHSILLKHLHETSI